MGFHVLDILEIIKWLSEFSSVQTKTNLKINQNSTQNM